MSRIIFSQGKQKEFLTAIKNKSGLGLQKLSQGTGKTPRTLNAWLNEKTSADYDVILKLSKIYNIIIPKPFEVKDDFWNAKRAAKIGGMATLKKHGNIGTPDGRRLGGKNALIVHAMDHTGFKVRKQVYFPERTEELAEFIGILMGDGGIAKYQVVIYLGSKTDALYAAWVQKFIKKLFRLSSSVIDNGSVIKIMISRVELVEFLLATGLSRGNKIINKLDIPGWIKENKNFCIGCLRGLIDTDGCVYLDKHHVGNKNYTSICVDFTSASPSLMNSVALILDNLLINFTSWNRSLRIRKEKDVIKYFESVNSHNPKHLKKYNDYFKAKHGEVA